MVGTDGFWAVFRTHQTVAFLVGAFAWTWAVWLGGIALGYGEARWLQAVGAWGPPLAAAGVTHVAGGNLREWAAQVVPKSDVGFRWYVFAVVAPLALTQTAAVVGLVVGQPVTFVDPVEVFLNFSFTLFLAGSLEEFGWRGFLQPRLQERWSALSGTVAVGLVWAAWHVPLAAGGTGAGYGGGAAVALFVGLPLFSVAMTWLYNSTRGGLLFVMLFHAVTNATPVIEAEEATALMGLAELAVLLGLPLVIVLYYGRAYLSSERPEPRIPGFGERDSKR